uniref:Zinc transporter ZIP10 n=1 Tax=Macrostomum lignano TaxID=282301 RepID=A0A1I8FUG3_9PLAT
GARFKADCGQTCEIALSSSARGSFGIAQHVKLGRGSSDLCAGRRLHPPLRSLRHRLRPQCHTDFLPAISMSPGLLSKAAAAAPQRGVPQPAIQPDPLLPGPRTMPATWSPPCWAAGGNSNPGLLRRAPCRLQDSGVRRFLALNWATGSEAVTEAVTETGTVTCLQLEFIHEEVNKENSSLIRDHHDHDHHMITMITTRSMALPTPAGRTFSPKHPWYLWRCCTVFGGIYLEAAASATVTRTRCRSRCSCQQETSSTALASYKSARVSPAPPVDAESPRQKEAPPSGEPAAYGAATVLRGEVAEDGAAHAVDDGAAAGSGSGGNAGSRVHTPSGERVQPVAWMIFAGDALHNFVDGLSIGRRQHLLGWCCARSCRTSSATSPSCCRPGCPCRWRCLCNFLSACTCYLGFALGVALGETDASVWIFAIASGMFLYIGLVDMLPAVSSSLEQPEGPAVRQGEAVRCSPAESRLLLVGFVAILMLAVYTAATSRWESDGGLGAVRSRIEELRAAVSRFKNSSAVFRASSVSPRSVQSGWLTPALSALPLQIRGDGVQLAGVEFDVSGHKLSHFLSRLSAVRVATVTAPTPQAAPAMAPAATQVAPAGEEAESRSASSESSQTNCASGSPASWSGLAFLSISLDCCCQLLRQLYARAAATH